MSGGGGGAIRNRSGERRWDSSPYSDRNYYSSSLVTTYLSPPPESRWRRTSSDSALYQKLTQPTSPNQKSPSEQGSPEYSPAGDDVKPAPELLETLLREGEQQLQTVKEEPQYQPQSNRVSHQSGSSSPVSPHYTQPTFLPPHQHHHSHHLEKEFRRFRLDVDCPPQFQDSGGNYTTTGAPARVRVNISSLPCFQVQPHLTHHPRCLISTYKTGPRTVTRVWTLTLSTR